jgi:hypothetical protein
MARRRRVSRTKVFVLRAEYHRTRRTYNQSASPSQLTSRFSGGALTFVPWHFIHPRPLQPVVMRLCPIPIHLHVSAVR